MKRLPLILILFGLLMGCEEKTTDIEVGQEWAHLTGVVKKAENLLPVYEAFVRTQTHLETTMTDSSGDYDLAIALPKDTEESVILEVYKEGFLTVNLPAVIKAGVTSPMPVITMERYLDSTVTDTGLTGSGPAEIIVLISLAPDTLSVAGSGGETSAEIICELRDASNKPVDSLHATQVLFELIEDPGGGAHLYPLTDVSDAAGRVSTTFNSGTDAGIAIIQVQVASTSTNIVLPTIVVYQTGEPASINLVSLEYDSIAVQGVGANEASTAIFVVKDAGGSPISAMQPVEVAFSILGGPGGGEYLYPESDVTDAEGQVSTTLNSGTISGALQLLAYLIEDSSISCTPVPVTIHSGFPDPLHFACVPMYVNFPGYNYYGRIDSIYALVGDVYANPVPMGTAVYFTSDAGIIQGSSTTDADGFAAVILFSGPPSPPAIYPFGTVTAQTVGQGGLIITDDTEVLFSGITQIYDVNPTSFDVPNGGSQIFTFRVSDQNGYPLAHDTEILVETTAGALLGDIEIDFPDTQSQLWTYFSFVLYDNNTTETDPAVLAAVSITVSSPNGDASLVIGGSMD